MAQHRQDQASREDTISSNGWTYYQELVLAELERHDDSLSKISEEIMSLKLGQGKIGSDIVKFSEQSHKGLETLKEAIDKEAAALKEARIEFSKAKEELVLQKMSINKINVKIGAAIATVSMLLSAGISALFKFLLQ